MDQMACLPLVSTVQLGFWFHVRPDLFNLIILTFTSVRFGSYGMKSQLYMKSKIQ